MMNKNPLITSFDIEEPTSPKETDAINEKYISSASKYFCFCIPMDWIVLPPDGHEVKIGNSELSTTFLLLNTMIGSGILVQAYVFMKTGILLALVEYLIIGCMIYGGVDLMTRCADEAKIYHCYSKVVMMYLGEYGGLVVDWAFVINNAGALLSYILIVGSLLKSMIDTSVGHTCTLWCCNIAFLTLLPIVLFSVPLCLIRNYGHLAIISYLSIAAICGSILLVIIGGPVHRAQDHHDDYTNNLLLGDFVGSIQSIGGIVFALGYITAIFQSYTAHKDVTVEKFSYITRNVTFIGTVMCCITGLVGYISFGSNTQANILENFNTPAGSFVKLVVAIHLILYIPGDFVILRGALWKLCGASVQTQADSLFIPLSLLLMGTITFVAVLLQVYCRDSNSLAVVIDVTGGIAGSLLYFIIPGWIGLKLFRENAKLYRRCIALLVFGSYIMITVAIGYAV